MENSLSTEACGKIFCSIAAWSDNQAAVQKVSAGVELVPSPVRDTCRKILACRKPDLSFDESDSGMDALGSVPGLASVADWDIGPPAEHYALAIQAETVLRKAYEKEVAASAIGEASRTMRDKSMSLADRLASVGKLAETVAAGPHRSMERLLEDLKADPKPETVFKMAEDLSLLSIGEYSAFKVAAKALVKDLNRNDLDAALKEKRTQRRVSARKSTNSLLLSPSDPMETAREMIKRKYMKDQQKLLWWSQEIFYLWSDSCYVSYREKLMRSEMWDFLDSAKKPVWNNETECFEEEDFDPNKSDVDNAVDALRAVANLRESITPPAWIKREESDPPANEIVAFKNGLLHLPTMKLYPPSPRFFSLCSLPFDYHEKEDEPKEWTKFLKSIWENDFESINLLQTWFGYCLLPDLRMQKILLMCGPKRSGKGTIARVLRQVLGSENVAGPSLAGLAAQFGLEGLVGKTLATISDARLSGRTDKAMVIERLLSISGEDAISVPRKFTSDWNGKLGCKLMLFSNELPMLNDISGALASRFLILMMTRSFYGAEDTSLDGKLAKELPGIVHWAIDGWKTLSKNGHFLTPESSHEANETMEEVSSPISAFIREKCIVKPGMTVSIKQLWEHWKTWAEDMGREHVGTQQSFGRDLRSFLPDIHVSSLRIGGDKRERWYDGITLNLGESSPEQDRREPGEEG